MFLSDEWNACVYKIKLDRQAIARLVRHDQIFWIGMSEVCAISESLVKFLRLVDGDKPTLDDLYKAMDKAKATVH